MLLERNPGYAAELPLQSKELPLPRGGCDMENALRASGDRPVFVSLLIQIPIFTSHFNI